MKADNALIYLKSLFSIIYAVVDLSNLDKGQKNKLINSVTRIYLERYIRSIVSQMGVSDRKKLAELYHSEISSQDKMQSVFRFLSQKVSEERRDDVALQELEKISKEMIQMANQSLKGEVKNKFNRQATMMLNKALIPVLLRFAARKSEKAD